MTQADHVRELVTILERLRGPGGCPWDREQTHDTLKRFLIEECGELLDALDDGDDAAIVDEIGDVLLQLVFHCQIAAEQGRFTFQDAARAECEKMVRRHPHVFGGSAASCAAEVVDRWEEIKRGEGRPGAGSGSVLAGVPRHLPALHRAQAVLRKAGKAGFEWPVLADALAKVREETAEVEEACRQGDRNRIAEELGDLLLAVVNVCRWHALEAEDVLQQAVRKFAARFGRLETALREQGRTAADCTPAELSEGWSRTAAEPAP